MRSGLVGAGTCPLSLEVAMRLNRRFASHCHLQTASIRGVLGRARMRVGRCLADTDVLRETRIAFEYRALYA